MSAIKVIKRDGTIVDYDRSKIKLAIQKANAEVPEEDRIQEARIDSIIDSIEARRRQRLLVEDIQDMVEQALVAENKFLLAKTYIIYRYTRALVRKHAGAEHPRHSRAYHSHLCPGWQVCPAFAARVRGT